MPLSTSGRPLAWRTLLGLLVALAIVLQTAGTAFAGTTGIIKGHVTDAATGAPVANVTVKATSASGTQTAATDGSGFYVMTGVVPDTYVVSFEIKGYASVSTTGISVFADETAQDDVALRKSLKTIATVTSRSTSGAFQPHSTSDSYTVDEKQLKDIRGNDFNLSEQQMLQSLPGVNMTNGCTGENNGTSIPRSTAPGLGGNTGTVGCALVIRGSRMNAVNWEFEGIPTSSATNNENMNAYTIPGLGLSSVQFTPGVSNASFGNAGSGTVNMLAARGTYPAHLDMQGLVGWPSFSHDVNLGWGTASPNDRWSNYVSFTAKNYAPRWGPTNLSDLEPYGGIGIFNFAENSQVSREFLDNAIFHFGKNNSKAIQFFADSGFSNSTFAYLGDPPPGYYFPSHTYRPWNGLTLGSVQAITSLQPGQTYINEKISEAGFPVSTHGYQWYNQKLEYDDHINPSTYLSLRAYNATSGNIINNPTSATWANSGGRTTGVAADFTKQLSEHHLIKGGVQAQIVNPIFSQVSSTTGLYWAMFSYGTFGNIDNGPDNPMLFDFLPNTECPKGTPGTSTLVCCPRGQTCGYLSQYFPNGVPKVPSAGFIQVNKRRDVSLYLTDSWTPNDKLKVDFGVRMDAANYTFPTPGVDPATCLPNYRPVTWVTPPPKPDGSTSIAPGNCPKATFDVRRDQTNPHIIEPRIALAYTMGRDDSLRFSYGRSVRFIRNVQMDARQDRSRFNAFNNVPATFPTELNCGGLNYQAPCQNYGDELYWAYENAYGVYPPTGYSLYKPETINNYEMSWSHQFTKGLLNGVGFRVTPWARRGYDAEAIVEIPLLDNTGNPVMYPDGTIVTQDTTNDQALEISNGIEFYLTRLRPYGLSVTESMNFTNAFTNVPAFYGDQQANSGYFTRGFNATGFPQQLYRLGYIAPFTSTTVLSYRTHNGWRLASQTYYNNGYPFGLGTMFPLIVNGQRVLLPWTNTQTSGNGSEQYVSPGNPGPFTNPNIAATRGFADSEFGQGLRKHPSSITNITIEKQLNPHATAGLTIDNIFDIVNTGAGFNNRWQPVATGVGGPESGTTVGAYPSFKNPNPTGFNIPGEVFYNPPTGLGRTIYVYFSARI